jgi:transformation/transcription domain-associated protein
VALKFPAPVKRAVVLRFLAMLKDDSVDAALKVLGLQLLVTPLLAGTLEARREPNGAVVDAGVVKRLMADALDTASLPHYPEALRVELLRLATLLMEHLGRELVEHRKELIKFAWNHLKSDDSASKMWAYVNVCRFIAVYETPPKIILQVYVALLRAHQPDARDLVQTALDVLVPALPRRLPASEFVKAIKWTKKIMFEEGHALPVLVHIFGLLVRHPALFYAYRSQFVPQMVQFFNRLGRFPNAALEHRNLAVALVSLVLEWEVHRRERLGSGAAAAAQAVATGGGGGPASGAEGAAAATAAVGSAVGSTEDDFTLPLGMIDMVVNFLTRISLFTADHKVRRKAGGGRLREATHNRPYLG